MRISATLVADIPPLPRREAMELAATEYSRLLDLLRSLTPDEWVRPTECEPWDVRTMVSHVIGATESHSSIREQMHQMRAYRKPGSRRMIDAMTALQVADRVHLSPQELLERLERAAPRSVRARRRLPRPLRRMRMRVDAPFDRERWPLSYLMDVIFTRDTWMHRLDITRATGRELVLTSEHDGRIVADVVGEWARRHGKPVHLVLDGLAGGTFVQGDGGTELQLDAIEFCRTLSGRRDGEGLLAQEVPF